MYNYHYKVASVYAGSKDAEVYFTNDLDLALAHFRRMKASQTYLLDQTTGAILLLKEYSIVVWVDDDVKRAYENE